MKPRKMVDLAPVSGSRKARYESEFLTSAPGGSDATYHFVDDASCFCDRTALETGMGQVVHQFCDCDISPLKLLKIYTMDNVGSFWNRLRALEHGFGRGGGCHGVAHLQMRTDKAKDILKASEMETQKGWKTRNMCVEFEQYS